MSEFLQQVVSAFLAQSPMEMLAVFLGLAYLLLAMKQSNWCWYAAFGSTAIFSWMFWDVSLLMESALNLYYLAMAAYGWWAWKYGSFNAEGAVELPVQRWHWGKHLTAWIVIGALTLVSGYLLTENTGSVMPYLDSFTTWGAVLTTWMVTRKVLENWLYWIVIDTAAIYLYLDRELYLTSALMAIYVVLAIFGWFMWRRDYQQHHQQSLGSSVDTQEAAA